MAWAPEGALVVRFRSIEADLRSGQRRPPGVPPDFFSTPRQRLVALIAAGGEHTRANVALAHNRCNWERGDTAIEFQMRLVA